VLLPYIYVWCTGVVITKKFFSVSRNRLLTYREIFSPDAGVYGETGMAAINDIELIENTAAEIRAASIEMNDRIDGQWETTNEDLRLQTQFWELFGNDRARNPDLHIGAEFLRQNADLLD
jgi:putative glycosyltransferase (TIGR04372 family)